MKVLLPFLFLVVFYGTIDAVIIPDGLKVCSRNKANDCLKDAISHGLKSLANGWPELDLPAMDPYVIKNMTIEYNNDLLIGKAFVENTKMFGFSSSMVQRVRSKLNDESVELEVDVYNKEIFVDGFYRGEFGLLPFLMQVESAFNNTISDIKWTWKIYGTIEIKNGEKYVKATKFVMRPKVGNMVFIQPGLLKDNPALSNIIQNYISRNWKLIYNEMLPFVELIWNDIGLSMCNKIFSKIPYDQLFPKN